jgi:hypothetical protein
MARSSAIMKIMSSFRSAPLSPARQNRDPEQPQEPMIFPDKM